MPWSPAASSAANARYGFASAPGIRVSGRTDEPWPTTRKPHVRLSWPQASVVGAQLPAAKRLYELIVGAMNTARSPRREIWPARYCSNSCDSPANALAPSRQSEEWMWQEEPTQSWCGFAMNVTEQPRWNAISLMPVL